MPAIRSRPGKWSEVTAQRSADYVAGVQSPRTPWAASTIAAAANQAAGSQAAIAGKRFEKGVAKAGDAKWQGKASTIGAARFPQGVQEGQSAYDQGFAPYAQTISSTQLPPKFPKGDPRNIQRVVAVAAALRARKLASG